QHHREGATASFLEASLAKEKQTGKVRAELHQHSLIAKLVLCFAAAASALVV
ncbi:unnamed protein product, partial [Ceratitis capitata]